MRPRETRTRGEADPRQVGDELMNNLLLTGPPGVGKTTLLVKVARTLGPDRVGGFLTTEIRQGGRREGFALVPLVRNPRKQIVAHVDFVSQHRVGRYGVDVDKLDYLVDTTLGPDAVRDAEVLIVDEVGKMECCSTRFVRAMERLLDDPRPLVATVAARGSGFIASVKARTDCELWTVDPAGRDALPDRVLEWLEGARGSSAP